MPCIYLFSKWVQLFTKPGIMQLYTRKFTNATITHCVSMAMLKNIMIQQLDILLNLPYLFTALACLIGLLVGSFLNVVIYRLPIMMQRNWRKECTEYLQIDSTETEPQKNLSIWFSLIPLPQLQYAHQALPKYTSHQLPFFKRSMCNMQQSYFFALSDYRSIHCNNFRHSGLAFWLHAANRFCSDADLVADCAELY